MAHHPNPLSVSDHRPIRLLQLSDAHLLQDEHNPFVGIHPLQSLQAVLAHTQQQAPFDCVISTGDLAQESTKETYQHYLDLVATLDTPHFWIKGNHDDSPDFPSQNNDEQPIVITLGAWCIILLTSQAKDCIYGVISDFQLQCLAELLPEYQDYHVILGLHHNTFKVGCKWLDAHSLQNKQAFLDCISPHQQVKIVLSGHVHQEFNYRYQQIDFLSCPSTCLQFKPNSDTFSLDDLPPGYRILELYPDGQYMTKILRLEHSIGQIDHQLKGY